MGAGLIGHDVGGEAALEERRHDGGGVAHDAHRARLAAVAGVEATADRVVDRAGLLVEVARLEPSTDALAVDVDAQGHATVQRDGQRLGATHPAEAGGERDRAGQRSAEAAPGDLGEALVGALEDSLRADVDPRAGGHLAVHRQPEGLEAAELGPVRPLGHEVGVGDEHPGRPGVGGEHPDRLARLDEQGLVVGERGEGGADGVEGVPRARRPSGAAVHDEVVGSLGHLGIEVVHQHAQRRLGGPRSTGERRPPWRPHRPWPAHRRHRTRSADPVNRGPRSSGVVPRVDLVTLLLDLGHL